MWVVEEANLEEPPGGMPLPQLKGASYAAAAAAAPH